MNRSTENPKSMRKTLYLTKKKRPLLEVHHDLKPQNMVVTDDAEELGRLAWWKKIPGETWFGFGRGDFLSFWPYYLRPSNDLFGGYLETRFERSKATRNRQQVSRFT